MKPRRSHRLNTLACVRHPRDPGSCGSCPSRNRKWSGGRTGRVYGPVPDSFSADEQPTSLSSAGNIIWPLTDHLGTARDLADQNESTYTTTVTNHRTYNAFGKVTAETNSAVDSDPSYTGKITDSDTNLQNNLNRWYDAVLGQWPGEDPVGFRGNDKNLRKYVGNASTIYIDPLGLRTEISFPPNMPQAQRDLYELQLMALLQDLANDDEVSIGGVMARYVLNDPNYILRIVIDPTLTANAFGVASGRFGIITINPMANTLILSCLANFGQCCG